jgi:hypothetical protein
MNEPGRNASGSPHVRFGSIPLIKSAMRGVTVSICGLVLSPWDGLCKLRTNV